MFSLGTSEILVILLVALLVYGKRLPDVARQFGKSFSEFKRGLAGLQREFQDEIMREPVAPSPRAPATAEVAPVASPASAPAPVTPGAHVVSASPSTAPPAPPVVSS